MKEEIVNAEGENEEDVDEDEVEEVYSKSKSSSSLSPPNVKENNNLLKRYVFILIPICLFRH